jgi:hypothetical protein
MLAAKEVKKILAALNIAESQFGDCIFLFDMVKQRAERIILNDQKRVIHAIRL